MFFTRRFKIFRLFGVDVFVDWLFFLAILLFGFPFYQNLRVLLSPAFPNAVILLFALITFLFFYACALAHEFAHAIVAKRNGIPVNTIIIFILGLGAMMEKSTDTPGKEFKIAIWGPLSNLIIAAILAGLFYLNARYGFEKSGLLSLFLYYSAFLNLVMAVFNLLPAYPMDGGRVLMSGLWKTLKNRVKAARIAVWVGKITAGATCFASVFGWLSPWFLVLGAFVFIAGGGELRQIETEEMWKDPAKLYEAAAALEAEAGKMLEEAVKMRARAIELELLK